MSTPAVSDNNAAFFQALVPGPLKNHFKNFTDTSSYSADLDAATTLIGLFSTQDCWCRLVRSTASDVAAVPAQSEKTSSFFLPGGICAFFGVPRIDGVQYKVAVVRDTISGRLHISEGA